MKSKVYFKETQRSDNKFLPILFAIICISFVVRGVQFLFAAETKIESALFLFVAAVAIGGIAYWYTALKLKVAITEKRVQFKLSPIHEKKHSIPWEEIEEYEVVRTPAASQWSGGNITFNHEKRFSLTGRNGLSIKTVDGDYFLIGCQDVGKLERALGKLGF